MVQGRPPIFVCVIDVSAGITQMANGMHSPIWDIAPSWELFEKRLIELMMRHRPSQYLLDEKITSTMEAFASAQDGHDIMWVCSSENLAMVLLLQLPLLKLKSLKRRSPSFKLGAKGELPR